MEMDPKEKLILKIRDVETRPIEVNVQSAGVSEEELKTMTKQKRKFGRVKNRAVTTQVTKRS